MIYSVDIETECAKEGCDKRECVHALVPHYAKITVAAVAWRDSAGIQTRVFRDLSQLGTFLQNKPLVGHNAKFDIKMLRYHGVPVQIHQYVHDTALMGTASYEKVSSEYLVWYEKRRKELNKQRRGRGHRLAKQHSLKTMAPYFLKVAPFWEAENHDDDDYVSKDARYALELYEFLTPVLKRQETLAFYESYLMPWSRMFLRAEERGVLLDFAEIEKLEARSKRELVRINRELEALLAPANEGYRRKQKLELQVKYRTMEMTAIFKKYPEIQNAPVEGLDKIRQKYSKLYGEACEKIVQELNLESPPQLKWLLSEYLNLDITGLDGKESTDKEVLEKLAAEGNALVKLLLEHREHTKLIGTYFSAYRDLATKNKTLHASFNLDIARTGRTSSNGPNLQNQPRELHDIFIARPGYKLITKDLSAIEPSVVAFYSEDPLLVDLIQKGGDFHGYNCNAILGTEWDLKTLKKQHPEERDLAKEVGLAVLYGAGGMRIYACSVKRRFKLTEAECRQGVIRLRDAWPDVVKFKKQVDRKADSGAPIENIFGRKRVFEPDDVYMKAFNSLIQGTASDLLLASTRRAQEKFDKLGIDAHLLMTVHDEVVFEVPEALAEECDKIITECMTDWKLDTPMGAVPLRVEGKISDRWEK